MTTNPYSLDLRIRVINYIKSGKTQASASRIYKVSTNAISMWWKRYLESGILTAKPRLGSKGKVDTHKLKQYVEKSR